MKIAVDFDGTIVEHKFPAIGDELMFSIETLKELQRLQHQLVLWTFRSGIELDQAVEYCKQRGLVFYAVNKNYPEEVFDETISRKVNADLFIDDRNIGGFPGWDVILEMIRNGNPLTPYLQGKMPSKRTFGAKVKELFSGE